MCVGKFLCIHWKATWSVSFWKKWADSGGQNQTLGNYFDYAIVQCENHSYCRVSEQLWSHVTNQFMTNKIFHNEYEYQIYSKYPFCTNTNTNLFVTLNLVRIRIWIYSFIPNIRIFEYFGTNICLNPKELDKYSFKEWKIFSMATKITHKSIPITIFYKKCSHLIKIWMIKGIYPKLRK